MKVEYIKKCNRESRFPRLQNTKIDPSLSVFVRDYRLLNDMADTKRQNSSYYQGQ